MIRLTGYVLICLAAMLSIYFALASNSCEDVVINHTVIGQKCQRQAQFPATSDENYDIQPEYQIAFLLEYPGFPTSDIFNTHNTLPKQRIPGTDLYYDFIPPELEPKLRIKDPNIQIQGCIGHGDKCDTLIIEKRPL